jgi:hypothetical protein
MRLRLHHAAAALAAVLVTGLAPSRARADLAPPPGYVETCTLEKQKKPELECHSCAAYHGNAMHCPESLEAYGFKQQCRSRGASVWSEVWCRPASTSAAKVPAEVIDQLGKSTSKAPPPPAGLLASPSATPAAPPAGTPAATPAGTPAAPPAAGAPEPPPVPPQAGGCGSCAAGIDSPLGWAAPAIAIAAAALALGRRRGVTTRARGIRRPRPRA